MEFSTLHDTLRKTSPAMSACPIPVLSAVLAPVDTPPHPVTESEQAGLQHALSAMADPRSLRGARYPPRRIAERRGMRRAGRRIVVHGDRRLVARTGRPGPGPARVHPRRPGRDHDLAPADRLDADHLSRAGTPGSPEPLTSKLSDGSIC